MLWPWRRRARHAAPRAARADTPAVPVLATAGSVRLGFSDGTDVELDSGDPSAMALRAVAEVLVQGKPGRAEVKDDATTARRTS